MHTQTESVHASICSERSLPIVDAAENKNNEEVRVCVVHGPTGKEGEGNREKPM